MEPIRYSNIQYLGGHVGYPLPNQVSLFFQNDYVDVEIEGGGRFRIPYNKIIMMQNVVEEETSGWKIVGYALVGAILLGILFVLFIGALGVLAGLLVGALIGYSRKNRKQVLVISFTDEDGMQHDVRLTSFRLPLIQQELYKRIRQTKTT
ncbi:MAG: hypothetical protein NXY59_08215 [Aigarchaeota archaeon]|nr:hypothetical protein [Candidatus Pelearchaeum maunauluense]